MDNDENAPIETDVSDSNPNATGPHGLRGDLGISSERTGPDGGTEGESATEGLQGTGSKGTATTSSEGKMSTAREGAAPRPGMVGGATGPEMDDTQQQATQGWREEQSAAGESGAEDGTDDNDRAAVVAAGESGANDDSDRPDRTVGERNTADVPSHPMDPSKNPGHSHG